MASGTMSNQEKNTTRKYTLIMETNPRIQQTNDTTRTSTIHKQTNKNF